MCYEIAAKRTKYRGIWFKSSLEARVAEALDELGVAWEYESRGFRGSRYRGGQYTPDFYLPELSVYIEVVGRIDDRHLHNARVFCQENDAVDLVFWPSDTYPQVSEDHPAFLFIISRGVLMDTRYKNIERGHSNLSVSQCASCGRVFFLDDCGVWECPYCGGDYGRHHSGNNNLFDYAERRRR